MIFKLVLFIWQIKFFFLIIPNSSSFVAKQRIWGGTKQEQNRAESIVQGIKINWNRMILWFYDKC